MRLSDNAKRKQVLDRLCTYIEHGMPTFKACEAVGIPATSFARYRRQGQGVALRIEEMDLDEPPKDTDPYDLICWEIWQRSKKAELDAMDRNLLTVQVASQTHWQAAAWWLERRHSKDFGRQVVQVQGDDKKPLVVEVNDNQAKLRKVLATLTAEQLAALETVEDAMKQE